MNRRTVLPTDLQRLADDRHGVLVRSDLLGAGLSRRVATRMCSEWDRLGPCVFRMPGDYDRWLQRLHGALLLSGEGAAAWGRTAAALWGLGDRPEVIEILTTRHRSPSLPWLKAHRDPGCLRRVVHVEPPRVSLEDAVIDTAALGSADDALAIVSRALQESRTTADRLMDILESRTRLRHRELLISAIGDSESGAHSALEHLYLAGVERTHRLPPMHRQYVVPETGHRSDGAYQTPKLLIELDGVRFHDRDADQVLDNRHSVLGYRTLRFDWSALKLRACECARMVGDALGIELPRRCRRCLSDG